MHATLTFSLPEDRFQHWCAVHGERFYRTLYDLEQQMRDLTKYDGTNNTTAAELAEKVRAQVEEVLVLVEWE